MASDNWSSGDAMPPSIPAQPQQQQQQQPPSTHQEALDRQLIRHLMSRYNQDEVNRIWQEEAQSPMSHNDAASVLTGSTWSTVKSEEAPSVFDSASSVRAFSDTSSRSSIISNLSNITRGAKFLGRKSQSRLSSSATPAQTTDDANWDTDDAAAQSTDPATAAANATKQKGAFMCGFCKEEGIQKTCTRKNDLKRHIEDFHNMNAQWFCRHRGCQMVFDWQTAYKTHLKHSHGGSRMSLDEAKVNLCQQTVFACGFENCLQVFEASSDGEAASTFKEYVGHVVKHFDEGTNSGEWTYSARIRNLLRQSGVLRAWTNSNWPEADRGRLVWHPQSSGILRKRLETRHIGDLQLLIQCAITLGSNPASFKFREDFISPVKETCQMMIAGHKIRPQPPPPAPGAAPDSDPFSFKISRNTDPSLAAYLASQRRVYVSRPPVRSGRSARPPTATQVRSTPAPSPMAPQYSTFHNAPPAPTMFDPQQQLQQQQQQQHHLQHHPSQQHLQQQHHTQPHHQQHQHAQQFGMMPQVNGGIVAEDLRSLRSMADNTPEPDIDMGDAQMMDSGYVAHPQHDFSGQYGPGGLQSPAPTDVCHDLSNTSGMEHHFGTYDAPHAY